MAPVVRSPVSEVSAPASCRSETQPVIASFSSTCAREGSRSFAARKPEIAARLLPAFGILAQGTQIRVPGGSVAVEDLALGDTVCDVMGDPVDITWIGAVTLCADALESPWLRRVQPERFGFSRPLSDVILGAAAEVVLDPSCNVSRALDSYEHDDMIWPLVPQAPVRLFQLGCGAPASVCADGLPVRTLDADRFLRGQPDLLAQMFAKLVPGRGTAAPTQGFVAASPFRRARLA
jgi:hypothetical protein